MLTTEEREDILDRVREIAEKIRDLEVQIDCLWYYIAENDKLPSNDTQ